MFLIASSQRDCRRSITEMEIKSRRVRQTLSDQLELGQRPVVISETMRNSGGMRLLRDRQVTDAILDYYRDVDFIASLQEGNLRGAFTPLLDGRQWDEVIDPGH